MAKSRRAIYDEDVNSTDSKPYKKVNFYLEELLNKKGSKREEAIASIVEALSNSTFKLELNFLENNFATFLYRCLNLFKKGSVKELHSASQAIGLLTVIIEDEENENEIYRELVPVISKALKSGPKTLKVFECLATATFFGASNSEETQTAMQLIWTFICPESESGVNARKHSPPDVLVAVISAWLFLLSSLERWTLSSKYWQGSIFYFSNLLENDDQSVRATASVALALIFEIGSLDKFVSREEKSCEESSTSNLYSSVKEAVKGSVVEKIELICLKPESDDAANKVWKEHLQVLDYFKNGSRPRVSIPIGRDTLVLSSWSKIIQLNYLKSFLGNHGLNTHMLENPKLQAVFHFTPTKKHAPRKELYVPVVEEVSVTYYLPKERDISSLVQEDIKKDRVMRSSLLDKAQTQLRNKNRKLATERKQMCSFDD